MIIGVTGLYAAGKDTVADYLKTQGFLHISLSDMIRDELTKRKKKHSREAMIDMGNEMRIKFGNGALAHRAVLKFEEFKNHVVTSIRHPEEVNTLRQRKDFVLVFVDAPFDVRYNRAVARQRETDKAVSKEQFRANEERELKGDGPGQQLMKCKEMADIILRNDATTAALEAKLSKILAIYLEKFKYVRPAWDDYFLEIARVVAKRSTCDRGMTAAIIVRDKRILTTGYAGAPAGLPQCDEIGHQFQEVISEEGIKSKHCVRTAHAEQNAIVQAARMGISIDGATIYCKMTPCHVCAKMIINAGVKRVVCEKDYHGARLTPGMFKQASIKLEIRDQRLETYANMK